MSTWPEDLRLIDDATDDMYRVRDIAAVLTNYIDGIGRIEDPVHEGMRRIAHDLVQLGERLRERHDAMFDAAKEGIAAPTAATPLPTRRRRA